MGMYEKIVRPVEAYAWHGPTEKSQFPVRFTPDILKSPFGGMGYVLDTGDGLQGIEPGDYVIKVQDDDYVRVRKSAFESGYRLVVNS